MISVKVWDESNFPGEGNFAGRIMEATPIFCIIVAKSI